MKTKKTEQQEKSNQKNIVRLPYLQKTQKAISASRHIPQKLSHDFDLRTSNAKLPKYNPQNDRNLKFFFQKQINKKILQKLKISNKPSSSKFKHSRAIQTQTQIKKSKPLKQDHRKRVNTVSSKQFMDYIQQMRNRITKSTTVM